mmetsp:Transcript_19191/g.32251  ORF Transcript_19191/g.32251 Transcript_19191/m.32251 type:complete len:226 (+) Transcript_19191:265-942(+)|eukprot:CAMPEP_0198201112 /NCGR_PEP_ID=MMETSP1445-20131203/3910_1 /TAXON_ID=36898 /ORGANISM="Pyramimonas sp., Strain CCMP2087" /LENGTH=225 /DNA_ID=CAMNT_0043871305 /DNA_START=264 /DNA_END=941 /DNA_ORIENTATION=+
MNQYPVHAQPGQPAYAVQAPPAQYAGMSYTQQPPSYYTLQQGPAKPTKADIMLSKAGTAVGNACSYAAKKTGNFLSHATAAGFENSLETTTGKCSYVAKMMAAGGTTKYWRKMFSPPASELLTSSFACYLFGQTGLVPGVMFVGTLSLAFASDTLQPAADQYLKVHLPYERISVFQPTRKGDSRYVGAIMLDGFQFWFSGFADTEAALKTLTDTSIAFRQARQSC